MLPPIKSKRGSSHFGLSLGLFAAAIVVLIPLWAASAGARMPQKTTPGPIGTPDRWSGLEETVMPPVAGNDAGTGFRVFNHHPSLTGNALTNDSDPNGSALMIKSFDASGTKGLVSLSSPWQDSSLDTTFGVGGWVTTTILENSGIKAVALQPDNKIVAAGSAQSLGITGVFALARYNPDGSLDTSFNGSGIATTQFNNSNHTIWAMVIQPNGKIIVGGTADPAIALARFNEDGSLDTSFSGDGKVTTSVGGLDDVVYSLALQPDGKILATGYTQLYSNYAVGDFVVLRYNANGSLDSTFSGDGKQITDFGGSDWGNDILLQSNGKMIVVGNCTSSMDTYDYHPALARYNANGSLDTSFGSGGKVITPMDHQYFVDRSVLQPDGKILVAGTDIEENKIVLLRYNSNGSLDATFGSGGKVITDNGELKNANSIFLQTDGKFLVVGSQSRHLGADYVSNPLILRFNPDGSLDTGFGVGGVVTMDIVGCTGGGYSVALQGDGKIILGGRSEPLDSYNGDFAIARVNKDGFFQRRNSFRYDPNGQFDALAPGEQAFDAFTYVASNGYLTDTATVTVTVLGGTEVYLPAIIK
jgi:uncharacterized delta-60 repeat protein